MLVRMAFWKCREESWGEDSALFTERAAPILRGCDGFVEAKLLGEAGGEDRIAFSIWRDSETHERFAESPDLAAVTRMFEHMYVDGHRPVAKSFEIRARCERNPGPAREE